MPIVRDGSIPHHRMYSLPFHRTIYRLPCPWIRRYFDEESMLRIGNARSDCRVCTLHSHAREIQYVQTSITNHPSRSMGGIVRVELTCEQSLLGSWASRNIYQRIPSLIISSGCECTLLTHKALDQESEDVVI